MMKDRMQQIIAGLLIYSALFGISLSASAKPPSPPVSSVNVVNKLDVEVVNAPDVSVANSPDVKITNTPDVNVANTPNVNIINTPEVSVGNTPNVNVVNTPNVNVVNTPDVNITNMAPIQVKTSNVYHFAGFSKKKLIGSSGIAALHAGCQSSFGAAARICTTKEIFKTPELSSVTTGQGWAHPVVVSEFINSANKRVMRDFSGLSAITLSMSCDGWSSATSGLLYAAGEEFYVTDCSVAQRISCCTPQ